MILSEVTCSSNKHFNDLITVLFDIGNEERRSTSDIIPSSFPLRRERESLLKEVSALKLEYFIR